MDEMQGIAKALMNGEKTIRVVFFDDQPEPDFINRDPDQSFY